MVFFKGTLISFYNTPLFFEEVNVGLILWDNGTKTDFRQISAPDERNGDNSDDTEIGAIHKGLVFMAWYNHWQKSLLFVFICNHL